MGKTAAGAAGMTKDVLFGGPGKPLPLTSKTQQDFINNLLQGQGGMGGEAFGQMVQPYDPSQFQDLFQQAYVDPAMMAYERNVMPAIQQRFVDADAGSSSALNQALAQSAADISTMIGQSAGDFYNRYQDRSFRPWAWVLVQPGNRANSLHISRVLWVILIRVRLLWLWVGIL